jgi:MYXO-CTERM domain-containing protein
VTGPPHGSRPACAGTGACQGQCDGTDPTKCSLPGSATECAAASCSGDVSQPAGQCDGAGSCTIPSTESCLPYGCDATSGTCKSACVSDADCGQGSKCDTATGKCAIAGATCKDAYTVLLPNGQEQSCEPYQCVGGACLDACATTSDCAPGYECSAPTCVPVTDGGGSGGSAGSGIGGGAGAGAAGDPGATSEDSGGCGCRVPSGGERRGIPLALASLLAIAAIRRRRAFTASRRA